MGETVREIYDTLNEDQKDCLNSIVGDIIRQIRARTTTRDKFVTLIKDLTEDQKKVCKYYCEFLCKTGKGNIRR